MFEKILCGRRKNINPHILSSIKIVIWDLVEETK
tara:strand:- start:107 stop:208 length:102 start_codon:yes stop_codon:yes gene_type:complete